MNGKEEYDCVEDCSRGVAEVRALDEAPSHNRVMMQKWLAHQCRWLDLHVFDIVLTTTVWPVVLPVLFF